MNANGRWAVASVVGAWVPTGRFSSQRRDDSGPVRRSLPCSASSAHYGRWAFLAHLLRGPLEGRCSMGFSRRAPWPPTPEIKPSKYQSTYRASRARCPLGCLHRCRTSGHPTCHSRAKPIPPSTLRTRSRNICLCLRATCLPVSNPPCPHSLSYPRVQVLGHTRAKWKTKRAILWASRRGCSGAKQPG